VSKVVVRREDIEEAGERIRGFIRRTPVVAMDEQPGLGGKIFLKLEFLQHTGSFKPRGAFNRILAASVPRAGIIAASGGNHGVAVAFAARRLKERAEVFVPSIVSPAKLRLLESLGAKVTIAGTNYAEALAASRIRAEATGALEVHAYDHPEVIAGQGTLARELEEEIPGLDTVLVAVGGGGLLAGIAAWFRGRARVVAVEPRECPTLYRALRAGHPVKVKVGGIAADSLGAREIGALAFPIAQRFVERAVLVTEKQIVQAQRKLWQEYRLLVEPGGAATYAALSSGAYRPSAGERIVAVLCGANVDLAKHAASLSG
jgi:threonine dehydratase